MSVRDWLVRRALGRLRITEDIVKHLSTFQRLGETLEVRSPGELLPVGARTVFRALRTRAASQLGPDWVWPWWLERQLDPASPAFVPRGHLPFLTNVTARNWTMIGNLSSPREAIVDPRGLVTTWFDGWSLDWWIGTGDRWHVPAREDAVRQRLLDAAPVVETAMSIPGGDAVHRAYAMRPSGDDGGHGELVIVEVENRSALPVAVALAVRPYNPEGLAVVERIALHDGSTVTVDGRVAMLLPGPPSRLAASTFYGGDSAATVLAGGGGESFPARLSCAAGLAQAAFVYPLAHRATLRVALPVAAERRTRRRRRTVRRVRRTPGFPAAVPSAAQVARGWAAQTSRGMRLELPDGRLAEAVDANRRAMLLFHDGDDITPGPTTYHRFWFRDAAYQLAALDRYGFHREAAEVLASYPARQHVDGFFFSQRQEWDANGCALWALAEHWRLARDRSLIEPMAASIGRGVHWIDRKRRARPRRRDPELQGLLPAGVSAEHLGPYDYFYWDDFWALAGLLSGAELLDAVGQAAAAGTARRSAGELRRDVSASLALVARRLGTAAIPAGPRRRIDAGIIASLVACEPLGLLPADDPAIVATLHALRTRFTAGPALYQAISHTGLGTYLTLQLALVELAAGDRRALDRLAWLLDVATPTWTWPEAVHPRLGGGCMGDGHHGWAAADFLSFVRMMLVREVRAVGQAGEVRAGGERRSRPEDGPGGRVGPTAGPAVGSAARPGPAPGRDAGLALCSMVPESWLGRGIEVRDAPTHHGRLSYALRWHGDRPALLWELDGHPGTGTVRLGAPGLDPSWSSTERKGEALLAPVGAPAR